MVTTQHPSLIDLPHWRFITNPLSYQERDSYRESCFLGKLFGKFKKMCYICTDVMNIIAKNNYITS